jgi:hypothetical protein
MAAVRILLAAALAGFSIVAIASQAASQSAAGSGKPRLPSQWTRK